MTMAKNSRGLCPKSKGASPFCAPPGMVRITDSAAPHGGAPMAELAEVGAAKQCLPSSAAAQDGDGPSVFARHVRMACGLLQTAIEEAAETMECHNVEIASELEDLQAPAIRLIHDSALATIDLCDAIRAAQTPGELAGRQAGPGHAPARDGARPPGRIL
jgi:hypothetical protein